MAKGVRRWTVARHALPPGELDDSDVDAERDSTNSCRVTTHGSAAWPLAPNPVVGRHYRTGAAIAIHHAKGRIAAIEPRVGHPSDLPWIAPPLMDLQVNGFAGVDFQRDGISASEMEQACQGLLAAGCGRFLLTLITDEWSSMLERLRHFRALRDRSPLLQATLAGWHVEGPFLSSEAGFHGAHPPELMLDPSPEHIRALVSVVGQDPLMLTLAPERRGAPAAIREAVTAGFRVSLGHTNASTPQLAEAIAAGASAFTHLGNACPKLLDRHDNVLWRVLDWLRPKSGTQDPVTLESSLEPPGASSFCCSLIPDGLHLPPVLFRVLHAAADPSRLFYVSDAMAGAGAPPGPATLGRLQLRVESDGIVRQPGKTHFAGSALRPIDGVFRASRMLGAAWADCWDRFSAKPAKWMGWPANRLGAGEPAHLCLFEVPAGRSEPRDTGRLNSPTGHVRLLALAGQEIYRSSGDCGDR